ncbi:MAG: hypothetical protein SF051_00615 [Elusimicrobiota bacterium]|nr:hypothetical protein [Elusimicrobiota bacterium]
MEKYPDFAGLADDFSDPPPGYVSDEVTARNIRIDLPDTERVEVFEALLKDARIIAASLDADWAIFRDYLNRDFDDADAAKRWLSRIMPIWEAELRRLKKGGR